MNRMSSSDTFLRHLPVLCIVFVLPLLLDAIAIRLQHTLCLRWCHEERLGIVYRTIGLIDSVSIAAGFLVLGLLVAFVLLLSWHSSHIDGFVLFVCALLTVPLLGVFAPLTFPPTDIVIPGLSLALLIVIHLFAYIVAWATGSALWSALASGWKLTAVDTEQWTRQQHRAWIVGWVLFSVIDFVGWIVFGIGSRAGITALFATWVVGICLLSWVVGSGSVMNHPRLYRKEREPQ